MKRLIPMLLALAVMVGIAAFIKPSIQRPLDTAISQIQATKTIRCGYLPYEPFISKDPNTGKLSGIVYDFFNAAAARDGYTIDWGRPLTIGDIVPSMESRKIDAFCIPCSPIEAYRKVLDFPIPFGYLPFYLFTSAVKKLPVENIPTARYAVLDGYIPMTLTPQIYPSATLVTLTSTASPAELFDQIRYGKAEALINEGLTAANYMAHNPGVLERNPAMEPRTTPMWIPTKKGDTAMAQFLTQIFGLQRADNRALFDSLLVKYNLTKDVYCVEKADCPGIPHDL